MTFQKKGDGTLMTLVHSGLSKGDISDAHEKGWNFVLDGFADAFVNGLHRPS